MLFDDVNQARLPTVSPPGEDTFPPPAGLIMVRPPAPSLAGTCPIVPLVARFSTVIWSVPSLLCVGA
jgi:hypothetical protein